MTSVQLPPLVCKSCGGTGIWDAGTEEEGKCGADFCHEGVLICLTCNDQDGGDEPAVALVRHWNEYIRRDEVFPLCGMHLERERSRQAREDRGDYERDMAKDEAVRQ